MTNQEIANIVDSEGLGYVILDYLSSDEIDDPVLKEKWKQAENILTDIQNMLPEPSDEGYGGDDDEPMDEEYS